MHTLASPSVTIVILVWNGKVDTIECLHSLSKDHYENKNIVIVDNGSTDGSVSDIRSEFPHVTVIENGKNLGFTGGNNVGIRYAIERGSDYVFLLNNDTTVEPDALSELVGAIQKQEVWGLLAPVIYEYYPPKAIWFCDSQLELFRGAAWHDNSLVPSRKETPYYIPWATGCAMLVPTKLMEKLGGFDERFYLSSEDVDLCVRVRGAGQEVGVVPSAIIYHKGGRSGLRMSGVQHYYAVRNSLLLLRKHNRGRTYARYAPRVVFDFLWQSLRAKVECRIKLQYFRTIFDAVRDHLLARYGPYDAAVEQVSAETTAA